MRYTCEVWGLSRVWNEQVYSPSSYTLTLLMMMLNSEMVLTNSCTRESMDHLSLPAYRILERFSHATRVTSVSMEQLRKRKENKA